MELLTGLDVATIFLVGVGVGFILAIITRDREKNRKRGATRRDGTPIHEQEWPTRE